MILHRMGPYGHWYEVSDPNAIRSRVELITFTPVQMLVQAKRVVVKEIFSQMPQQSDYVVKWQEAAKPSATPVKNPLFAGAAQLFRGIKTGLGIYRQQSLGNRKFFRRSNRGE